MEVNHDRVAGMAIALLSGCALAYAFTFPDEAALYIKLIATLMLGLSLALWGRTFSASQRKKAFTKFFPNAAALVLSVGATLLYFAAVEFIGFYTASAVFIFAAAACAGLRRWKMIGIGTIIYLVFVFVVFDLIFSKEVTPEIVLTFFR